MLCFLYACFVPPRVGFLAFVCIFVYMFIHVSLCACLCYQTWFLPMISCGFTSVFVHKISSPFYELCLMAHVSSILQYNGTLLVCPFVCFLSLFAWLVYLPSAFSASLLSLLLVCWLCVFFVFCMYTLGVRA